jgi:hypothetical protein
MVNVNSEISLALGQGSSIIAVIGQSRLIMKERIEIAL